MVSLATLAPITWKNRFQNLPFSKCNLRCYAAALKIPPMAEYDPELLQLTGSEDLFTEELPGSPMSLTSGYGKMRWGCTS